MGHMLIWLIYHYLLSQIFGHMLTLSEFLNYCKIVVLSCINLINDFASTLYFFFFKRICTLIILFKVCRWIWLCKEIVVLLECLSRLVDCRWVLGLVVRCLDSP
jgi:hypothetical protein